MEIGNKIQMKTRLEWLLWLLANWEKRRKDPTALQLDSDSDRKIEAAILDIIKEYVVTHESRLKS